MSDNDTDTDRGVDERPAEAILPGINGVSYEVRRQAIDQQHAELESDQDMPAMVRGGEDPFVVESFEAWLQRLPDECAGVKTVNHDEFAGRVTLKGQHGQRAHFLTRAMAEKFLRNGYVVVEVGASFVTLRQVVDDPR